MSKTAFLFSGQGTFFDGMGIPVIEKHGEKKEIANILEAGEEVMGDVMPGGLPPALTKLPEDGRYIQVLIFAVSLLASAANKADGSTPDAVAGHSLGEYAALVEAGVLSVRDGFRIVRARADAMHACPGSPGGMSAILGGEAGAVEDVCREISADGNLYVTPVNYNSPEQTVISGLIPGLELAEERLKSRGICKKTVRLAVPSAFHTKFMAEAAELFRKKTESISGIVFNKPSLPFYSNLTGGELDFSGATDSSGATDYNAFFTDYLCRHMCSPVLFTKELAAMVSGGVTEPGGFIECGPKPTLTAFVKKTLAAGEKS
ncbi:malonyl CoA-acyl carrier protein transacylase [Clostridia bacterium]|nr:malonyl CoA-acyl carrier protein transacylase [Clostridia bacterium]